MLAAPLTQLHIKYVIEFPQLMLIIRLIVNAQAVDGGHCHQEKQILIPLQLLLEDMKFMMAISEQDRPLLEQLHRLLYPILLKLIQKRFV